jgi:O-antigen ligase
LTGKSIVLFHGFRPISMSFYCLLAIIIAFEKIYDNSIGNKNLLLFSILLLTSMIFLLSERIIIFSWLIVVMYFLLELFQKWQYKFMLATSAIFMIIVSGFAIPSVKKQWTELFDFSPASTITLDQDASLGRGWGGKALRVAIWKCSTDILEKHLLIGVGTGDVQDSLQQAYENRKFYFASKYNRYNAHNEYLQITLANGLPGLLILLSCIAYPLIHYRKKFTGNAYLLFLLLFTLVAVSESLLEINKGIIWYSFFNSIFAFGYLKSNLL